VESFDLVANVPIYCVKPTNTEYTAKPADLISHEIAAALKPFQHKTKLQIKFATVSAEQIRHVYADFLEILYCDFIHEA